MKDVLSQAEVDALLAAIQQQPSVTTSEPLSRVDRFDLAREHIPKKQRLPGFEQWNRRFADIFRESLGQSLNREVDISLSDTRFIPCAEYLHSLYVPTSINLMRVEPLPGTAMLALDSQLVFRLVEAFFGGEVSIHKSVVRHFSLAERRVVGRVVSMAHRDFELSAKNIAELKCEPLGSEINPSLVSMASPSELLVVSRFQVDIDGVGGEMQLALPLKMLELLKESLALSSGGQFKGEDSDWRESLANALLDAPVATRYVLEERVVKLADIVDLQVGDVLSLTGRSAAITAKGRKITGLDLAGIAAGIHGVENLQLKTVHLK